MPKPPVAWPVAGPVAAVGLVEQPAVVGRTHGLLAAPAGLGRRELEGWVGVVGRLCWVPIVTGKASGGSPVGVDVQLLCSPCRARQEGCSLVGSWQAVVCSFMAPSAVTQGRWSSKSVLAAGGQPAAPASSVVLGPGVSRLGGRAQGPHGMGTACGGICCQPGWQQPRAHRAAAPPALECTQSATKERQGRAAPASGQWHGVHASRTKDQVLQPVQGQDLLSKASCSQRLGLPDCCLPARQDCHETLTRLRVPEVVCDEIGDRGVKVLHQLQHIVDHKHLQHRLSQVAHCCSRLEHPAVGARCCWGDGPCQHRTAQRVLQIVPCQVVPCHADVHCALQQRPSRHQQEQTRPDRKQGCTVEVHRQQAATHSVVITKQHPLEVVAAHCHVGQEGGDRGPAHQQCFFSVQI